MAFADELRKKCTNYDFKHTEIDIVSRIVNQRVTDCICGIKDLCLAEAQKGKTNISGYLSVKFEEYATSPTATVSEGRFEPFKDTRGEWHYTPPYSFDYGINTPVFETSNEDRLKIAVLIKDGILNGLKDCSFSHLSASVVTKTHYSRGTFFGKVKYSKSSNELHCIYISISWK